MPEISKHETCLEYFRRRLSEGWKCISLEEHKAVLLSPDGIRRELDLRNDVETLRPSTTGDETNLSKSGSGGYNYDRVDEVSPDYLATFVYTVEFTYKRDLYNLPASSGSGTINFIKVYACCVAEMTPDHTCLKIVIKSGTGTGAPDTVDESSGITLTTDFAPYSNQWNTNPATGNPFTWDEIDKLQIGVSLRSPLSEQEEQSACTQVYVEVDYTAEQELTASPVAETSSVQSASISGSGNAPLTSSPIAVASSIQASAIAGTGIAPLVSSPIAVASSIQQATIAGAGEAPLTASPVAVTSSVQAAEIGVGLIASPIAVASSVQTATVITSIQYLIASPVAVASSIQNAALAAVGVATLASVPLLVTSSIVAATIAGSGTAPLTASPVAVLSSVLAARVFIPGRPLSPIVITSQYRKVQVFTGFGG